MDENGYKRRIAQLEAEIFALKHKFTKIAELVNEANKAVLLKELYLPISGLNLPTMVKNSLTLRAGLVYVKDLVVLTENELLKIQYLGKAGLTHIKSTLEELGLTIGMKLD